MADEQFELRRINWTEVFSFTHIFKSFRMAVHLSKMLLAFAAIVVVFGAGWVLDAFWGLGDQYVRDNEIGQYAVTAPGVFAEAQEQWRDGRVRAAAGLFASSKTENRLRGDYKSRLPQGRLKEAFIKELNQGDIATWEAPDVDKIEKSGRSWSELLDDAEESFDQAVGDAAKLLKTARKKAKEGIGSDAALDSDKKKDDAREQLGKDYLAGRRALSKQKLDFRTRACGIRGGRIFLSLIDYELNCLDSAITAVRHGNITGGLGEYRRRLEARGVEPVALDSSQPTGQAAPVPANQRPGFLVAVLMGSQGAVWLFAEHWVYAGIFSLICLFVVAFFGGAINRIAALHFAREEKISMTQAMRFSCGKFFSFLTAPLIPLGIILAVGGIIAFCAMIGNIPYVGEIIVSIPFFLAILGGVVIAFLLIGLVAGGPLMYPTIAVEGSDSFDAMSRSFSYVFARPWRALFYGLVALVYGVITYLFVRLFAFVALAATHLFVSGGIWANGPAMGAGADKLDVIWQKPTYDSLFGRFNWAAMNGTESFAAFVIGIWVFIVAGMVGAFLLSYLASSTTAIYFLLRRKVDATDLDDVYVEEAEKDETPLGAEPPAEDVPPSEPPEEETPPTSETPKGKKKKTPKTPSDDEEPTES